MFKGNFVVVICVGKLMVGCFVKLVSWVYGVSCKFLLK